MTMRLTSTALLCGLLASGCGVIHKPMTTIGKEGDALRAVANTVTPASESANRRLVESVDGVYLTRRSVPLDPNRLLPPVFSEPNKYIVTLVSSEGRVDLATTAEWITKVTGIPVEINANTAGPVQASVKDIPLDFRGPLSKFLDLVALKTGTSWEFEEGRIHLYRFKTRVFELKGFAGSKSVSTSFSSSGAPASGEGSGTSGASVSLSQSQSLSMNFMQSLKADIDSMLSTGGKAILNEPAGTLTVTDRPSVLKQAERIIAEQNRRASRTVHLRVEVIQIADSGNSEVGFDVRSVITSSNGKLRLIGSSPNSMEGAAGSLGAFVLGTSASVSRPTQATQGAIGDAWGAFQGTGLFIQALEATAKIASRNSVNAFTINSQPVPVTLATSESFVESIGATTSQTAVTTTVTQKTVNTGVFLQMLPRILDSNQMLLQYTVDLSELESFDVSTIGGGTIKSPRIPRRSTTQTVLIRPGESILLSHMASENARSSDSGGLFGFGRSRTEGRQTILILITPVLLGGES
jgi:type IVB pilus formation R64 PilN family outer membrane protein